MILPRPAPVLLRLIASRRVRRIAVALAAVGATLAAAALPAPAPAPSLAMTAMLLGGDIGMAIGLAIVTLAGLLIWHVARLTTRPVATPLQAALPASLFTAALLPLGGVAALLPALLISSLPRHVGQDQRVVAILVQCSATLACLAALAPTAALPLLCSACAIIVLATLFSVHFSINRAANDNPFLIRGNAFRRLSETRQHVTVVQSNPGNWGISDVQQERPWP